MYNLLRNPQGFSCYNDEVEVEVEVEVKEENNSDLLCSQSEFHLEINRKHSTKGIEKKS